MGRITVIGWMFLTLAALLSCAGLLHAGENAPPSMPPDAPAWTEVVANWPSAGQPFSFVYDGKSSRSFLHSWQQSAGARRLADRTVYTVRWLDPKTGLKLDVTAIAFHDFPAIDWVLRFENTGTQDTPILEKVLALDIATATPAGQDVVLDQINGDDCSERSFMPVQRVVKAGDPPLTLAPVGGRPSNGTFPFFNIQCGSEGCFAAIGWTGQWSAVLGRQPDGAYACESRHGIDPFAAASRRGYPYAADHALALERRPH